MKAFYLYIVLFLYALTAADASADFSLIYAEINREGAVSGNHLLYISNGNVRTVNETGKNGVLYTAEENLALIDDQKRIFSVFDPNAVDQEKILTPSQKKVVADMEERIRDLPPEKQNQIRAVVNNSMKYSIDGEKPEKERYLSLPHLETVRGHKCSLFEIHRGSKKVYELCVVDRQTLNIPDADYVTLGRFISLVKEVIRKSSSVADKIFPIQIGYEGNDQIPVRIIRYSENGEKRQYELKSFSGENISSQKFSLPSEYKEQKLPR